MSSGAAALSEILDVESEIKYYNDITNFEYHSHGPYANQKLTANDEIRIPINSQEVYTLPCRSFLLIEGTCMVKKNVTDAAGAVTVQSANYTLISNAIGQLFDELRFELAGISVSKSRLVGVTSTIKSLLLKNAFDKNAYHLAGFDRAGYTLGDNTFSFCIPLKLLLPFFEDFQHIILNLKQELVLLRTSSDINCIQTADGTSVKLEIQKLVWKVPYIRMEDQLRLKFLKILDADRSLKLPFRTWQVSEFPSLPLSKNHSWTVKTASHLDVPKFMILAFQTAKKLTYTADVSKFDFCDLYNVKLHLNSHYYPYDNLLGNKKLMYKMFLDFAKAYYNLPLDLEHGNEIDYLTFIKEAPIIVIDCSHQEDLLKSSIDIRLEIEFSKPVPESTSAYCILVSDSLFEYKPLTSIVREVQ